MHCTRHVAHSLFIRNATRTTNLGSYVFRSPMALTVVEIGTDGSVAVVGELTRGLSVPFILAGGMVD